MTTKAQALALYAAAVASGGDLTQAAHALAAALTPKPRQAANDLAGPVGRPKRGATVATVLCEWADGSSTYQRVAFNKPAERWAAAFQACDRLRRLRLRRLLAGLLALDGVHVDGPGSCGVRMYAPDFLALADTVPLPHLTGILIEETGDAFEPDGMFGAGDVEAADLAHSNLIAETARRHAESEVRRLEVERDREAAIAAYHAMRKAA